MAIFAYYKISTVDITTISAVDTVSSTTSGQSINGSPRAITICNNDASGDACTVDLFINSETNADLTDTGTNVNEIANYPTDANVTLTVDGTAATADVFVNEKVYGNSRVLLGVCSARNSDTEIVLQSLFSDGLQNTPLLDNENLFTGTRHYILHDVVIPAGSTLVLEQPELNYDSTLYSLKFKLTSVSGSQIANIKVEY